MLKEALQSSKLWWWFVSAGTQRHGESDISAISGLLPHSDHSIHSSPLLSGRSELLHRAKEQMHELHEHDATAMGLKERIIKVDVAPCLNCC